MQTRSDISHATWMESGIMHHTAQRPARRKKILFVIDTLEMGGAEQSLLENCTRFTRIEPVICHLYKGELLKPRFTERGICVYSVNLSAKYDLYNACKQLKAIVKKELPDGMVACLTRSEIVSRIVARMTGIPVAGSFVSDLYAKSYNQQLSVKARLGVALFRGLNKLTTGFCAGFIANSEAVKISNARQLGIAPEKIEVINRGRDSKLYAFRPRMIISENPVRFLNIGRLVSVKGQLALIQAFRTLLSYYPTAELHIAGEGPMRSSLQALIEEYSLQQQVRLLGNRTDLPVLIQEYDCFVFPSYSEGFSGSVIEAMMSGLPVLASRIPANKEVITHLESGYLFDAGSIESIARAMFWYMNNRTTANHIALNARRYAVQHFEPEAIAGKMENYLCSLTRNHL